MSAVDETFKRRSLSLDGESSPERKPKLRKQRKKAPLRNIIGVVSESENEANEPDEDLIYQEIESVPNR